MKKKICSYSVSCAAIFLLYLRVPIKYIVRLIDYTIMPTKTDNSGGLRPALNECIVCDTEVCKGIAIIRGRFGTIYGN